MADDERRADIEAVARWLYEHDAEFLIRSGWDSDTEGLKAYYYEQAVAILNRVRDARGDDEGAELVALREAVIEHRKHHPTLTSNADTELWWKASLDG